MPCLTFLGPCRCGSCTDGGASAVLGARQSDGETPLTAPVLRGRSGLGPSRLAPLQALPCSALQHAASGPPTKLATLCLALQGAKVFHAGTAVKDGQVVSAGAQTGGGLPSLPPPYPDPSPHSYLWLKPGVPLALPPLVWAWKEGSGAGGHQFSCGHLPFPLTC